jgi:hypothetical protein
MNFFKDEKRSFQSSEMKNEFHVKFRDKNNNLTFFFFFIVKYC